MKSEIIVYEMMAILSRGWRWGWVNNSDDTKLVLWQLSIFSENRLRMSNTRRVQVNVYTE